MRIRPEHIPERFKPLPVRNDNYINSAMFVQIFTRVMEDRPELVKEVLDAMDAKPDAMEALDIMEGLDRVARHPLFTSFVLEMTWEEFQDPTKFDVDKRYAEVHDFVKGLTQRTKRTQLVG